MGALILPSSSAGASTAIVMGADNIPVPPSAIVERCKRIHPCLGLRFSSGLAGSGWSITWEWSEHDRRREWIKDGRVDPASAYDVVGYLPFGCSVDEAPGYIERSLKQYPREEVSRLTSRMTHWNAVEIPAQQVNAAVVETVDQTMADKRQKNPRRTRVR